ncbi:MAG: TetR/AcrR family transcriptional regulator [Lactococcus lactis]|nr:TetR/AcrR family transcriptional regulator [Lactococcus lactis]
MNQTEKKKKAILETTFHLLNQKTIREITVDEIAHKADVSKVTLFKYFHSKNQ